MSETKALQPFKRGPTVISNESVYQAYVDLCGASPPVAATRKAVAEQLGIGYKIIDEHTDRLIRAGRIRPVIPGSGIFEPAERNESRAVSFTAVPNGGAKLEIGDQVLDLQNMREGWVAYGLLEGWLKAKLQQVNPRKNIPAKAEGP